MSHTYRHTHAHKKAVSREYEAQRPARMQASSGKLRMHSLVMQRYRSALMRFCVFVCRVFTRAMTLLYSV